MMLSLLYILKKLFLSLASKFEVKYIGKPSYTFINSIFLEL